MFAPVNKNIVSNPVIIIGSGRSGTTILSEIIFNHEQLAWPSNYQEMFPSLPQINLIRNIFDNKLWKIQGQKPQLNKVSIFNKYFFKPAEAYNFWEKISGSRIDFSRGFLLNEKVLPQEKEFMLNVFLKMVKYQHKKRLAFKITGPAKIGYLTSIFDKPVFVNVVRKPFPTMQSWLQVDFWEQKGKNKLWWTGAYSEPEIGWAKNNYNQPALLAALQYRKLKETTDAEIKKHAAKCITVNYEDFVTQPHDVIKDILDFCDLPLSNCIDKYMLRNKIFNQDKKAENKNMFSNEEKNMMENILKNSFSFQ